MRFNEGGGIFWEPFVYKSAARKRSASSSTEIPKLLPPIPDTGWKPPRDFPDLSAAKALGIDIETCDPDLREKGPGPRRGAFIVGASVATSDGLFKAYYPVAHAVDTHHNLDKEHVFAWLRRELSRPKQPKIGANLLYDLDFLTHEAGVEVKGSFFDVQYADPLIDEYAMSYSLDAIAERRLGRGKETSILYDWCAEAFGGPATGEQRKNIWRSPPSLVGPYAEVDAFLPIEVFREQVRLMREMDIMEVFRMECSLIPLLLRLRQRGVPVDLARAQEIDGVLTGKIEEMQKQFGEGFSVNAPEDIRALCDREGIEYPYTAQGNPSFTKPWLLAHEHPTMRAVSELRKVLKMRDSFIRGAIMGTHINGRIHCEFNPLRSDDYGTVSGRFSSSHPNLQQVPARDKLWAPLVRSCFIPTDGRIWGKNDLSQIEFRLGAHFGIGPNAEEVREAYRRNPKTDFYNLASDMTELERQDAKSLSLGTLYGMRVKKFASMIGKSIEEAAEVFDTFNEKLPFMHETFDAHAEEARNFGFVRTIGGRVCHLDERNCYKALNRKLQGSCADWIKKSMLDAYQRGLFDELEIYLTVHDELDYGALPTRAGLEALRELHQVLCSAYPLLLPVRAGIDIGRSWGVLDKIEDLPDLTVARMKSVLKRGVAEKCPA